jgi:hypothetical protein
MVVVLRYSFSCTRLCFSNSAATRAASARFLSKWTTQEAGHAAVYARRARQQDRSLCCAAQAKKASRASQHFLRDCSSTLSFTVSMHLPLPEGAE